MDREKMSSISEHSTFCHICGFHCALKVAVKDGKVMDVRGDGASGFPCYPCSPRKGKNHIRGTLNSPDRLKYPLKREGRRGEGKWERISWDEALDTIADRLLEIKEEYGPERVVMVLGEPKGMEFAFGQRFATAFGTPNAVTPGGYCGVQTTSASIFTFGSPRILVREDCDPNVVIIWGSNFCHCGGTFNGMSRGNLYPWMERGCKVVVIDPRDLEVWPEKNIHASDVDYWIRPRPNSDGILVMGMIKVIIEEELYDEDFVEKWTLGFDDLREHVKTFTLDDVEKLTWVPQGQIKEVARMYATNRPSIIGHGNALENNSQAFQALRALAILRGISCNVNTPDGAETEYEHGPIRPGHFMLSGKLKERLKEMPRSPERTIGGEFPVTLRSAYVPTHSLVKALLEEEPYLPKAALLFVTNPLLTYPDSKKTREAFMKLDFLVVSEIFETATTEIADIVLPAATIHEHETIGYWPGWIGYVRAHPKIVDPPGEAWPDMKIINELAKRTGLGEYFWEDEREALDYILEPTGYTYEEFRDEVRFLEGGEMKYDPEKVSGYGTPSGKMEIYSKQLEDLGVSPMPKFEELVEPISGSFELTEDYPLVVTNYKSKIFMLSGYRKVSELREKSPNPIVFMNTETASELGLEDGDWVYVETRRGKMKQKLAKDSGVHPKIVIAEFGWGEDELEESNFNVLTDCDTPYEPATGTVTLRGYPCKVYKA